MSTQFGACDVAGCTRPKVFRVLIAYVFGSRGQFRGQRTAYICVPHKTPEQWPATWGALMSSERLAGK